MVNLSDAAARGAGITLGAQAVRFGIQFGSLVVLARLLTPQDFGLVAMVTALIGIANLVRDFGLSSAAVQAKVLTDNERNNLFWANTALGLVCAAAAIAATPLIVRVYGNGQLTPIVPALASVFLLSGLATQFMADLTRKLRFVALALADVLAQALSAVLAILLALRGAGYWAIVAQQVSSAVISLVVSAISSGWLPGWFDRTTSIRRFFRFGGGVLGTQAISYATKNVDNVLIGAYLGAGPLGLYSRAYQLLMMPLNQINAPLTRVALPVLSRINDDAPRYGRYLERAQLVACYFTAPLFAVAAALSDPLVQFLFGSQWEGLAEIFAVLAIGGIFRAVSQITYWIYLSQGATGAQLKLFLWTRPLMIAAIAAGLPWGAVGVAAGHSVAYAFYWIVSLWSVGRTTGVDTRPLMKRTAVSISTVGVPCAAAAYGATFIAVPNWLQIVCGLALAAVALLAIAGLSTAVRRDLTVMADFARRAVRRGGA